MKEFLYFIYFIGAGIVAVTLIATIGAMASNRFKFNYGVLTILSFIVYATIAAKATNLFGFSTVLLINLIIGFYDATIGWKLSKKCKANTGLSDKEIHEISESYVLTATLIVSFVFTLFGYLWSA